METAFMAIQRIFPTVLRMSLSASILVFAVIALRLLLRKAPRWLLCLLWGLVAVRLICPILPETKVSVMPGSDTVIASEERLTRAMDKGLPPVAFETPRDHAVNSADEASGQNVTVGSEAAPSQYLPLLWLAGFGAMQLYALGSYLRLKRRVSVFVPYKGCFVLCDGAETPFILGVFRPRVYLPSGLTEPQLSCVLAHENAHLQRRDHWWKPFGFLLLSVHWFNPVLWLAYTLLCRDIELACDEKVIRHLGRGERADYSQALLDCSRVRHRISACPVAFGETDVKARVKAVLNYKKPAFWIVLSALLCCVVLIVCFVTNPKQEQDLSFLNYKNAIPLLGMDDTAPYAVWYPEETSSIQPGVADSKALARYLEEVSWTRRRAPRQKLASPGSIEFIIEDGYRITVYRSARIAVVQSQDAVRYYRTGAGDYEAALAVFIPAPSTEPEIDGREAEAIGIYDRSYWAEVERVLAPFASPASMEIYLSERFDADLPADSVFGDLTLRDYIYGTDDWKFEYNGPRLANDPEAAIIVRDFDGRTLWIMSDADALMIEESDGSITWASWGDAVDCADMIRHLLHWAQGRDPSEKEAAAERAAAAQRLLADLGHYTLSGREPLREEAGTTLPFWAKMSDSRISAGGAWAIAYFGTEEMSADLRYDRLYWNGDPSQPLGAESFSMCRRTYAASGEVKDVRIGGHDAFLTDVSGFAGRRLIWYDQESDLLFSLVASHISNGQIAGTFSEAELIAMAESVTPAKQSKGVRSAGKQQAAPFSRRCLLL